MCAMTDYKVPSEARAVTEENPMGLLPGFRFHPTDEEIIVHYLMPKVTNSDFSALAIGQVDFNKCEPWDLPKIVNTEGTEERYYYCLRDKKYPTGLRTNRATKAGYWKATGKDREIFLGNTDPKVLLGMKKTLVFYRGRAPRGEKTNWVMHEFRFHPQFDQMPKDDYGWVVSRVFHKNADGNAMPKRTYSSNNSSFSPNQGSDDSFSTGHELIKDDEYDSLPPLIEASSSVLPPPHYAPNQQLQDLKPAIFDAYDEDQLLYAGDPSYYYPTLPDSLIQTTRGGTYEQHKAYNNFADGSVMESFNCKVENCFASYSTGAGFSSYDTEIGLNAMINNNYDNVEIPENGQGDRFNEVLPSTMGSMPDLSHMWDV